MTMQWKSMGCLPEPDIYDKDNLWDQNSIPVYYTDGKSLWDGFYFMPSPTAVTQLHQYGWFRSIESGRVATHWERSYKVRHHLVHLPKNQEISCP